MSFAVYPGSFDPFTLGHKDILLRSSKIFDKVIVAIGENHSKNNLYTVEERINDISNEINADDAIHSTQFRACRSKTCQSKERLTCFRFS